MMTVTYCHINFRYSLNRLENFHLNTLFLPEAKLIDVLLKKYSITFNTSPTLSYIST